MTVLDALMPGAVGAPGGSMAGARQGGGVGNWRQAVEQAQAKSWLQDRNVAVGQRRPDGGQSQPAPFAQAATSRLAQTATPSGQLPGQASAASTPVAAAAPPTVQAGLAVRAGAPGQAAYAMPMAAVPLTRSASGAPQATATLAAAAAGQGEILRAARARKQSIHAECGEQGVSVWIRDASLNSREASHLAAAIASALSSGRQDVASLYLNGRPLTGGLELSSPHQSE